MNKMANRSPFASIKTLGYVILLGGALFYIVPIVWVIASSFKPLGSLVGSPFTYGFQLFFTPTLDAYYRAVLTPVFVQSLGNSLIVATSTVALSMVLGIPAAYTLARVKNSFTRNVATWIISTRMIPPFAIILPFYLMMIAINLLDSLIALIIVYLTFNLSFTIWAVMGYFQEIPPDLEESAMVDGCSRLGALVRVLLPLSAPALVAVGIIAFLLSWNEFLFAFVLTSTQSRTVPVQIANQVGMVVLDWPAMTAMSTILLVPGFIALVFAQKYIVRGLTLGAMGKM